MEEIKEELFNLVNKSLESEDVPVGAIIIKDNEIIGKGYNTREKDQNILGHAEINAILDASKKLNNWNLSDTTMFVTLKPCKMCEEIIKQSRISNVYYLLEKPSNKQEYSNVLFKQLDDINDIEKYNKILSNFFKYLREKSK